MIFAKVIAILFVCIYSASCLELSGNQNNTWNDKISDCPKYCSFDEVLGETFGCQSDVIEITFNKTENYLSEVLSFTNKSSVSLNGIQNTVHINCQNNAGIIFDHIAMVNITNIVLVNCGTLFNATEAAIVIHYSDWVYMFNISVNNSFGLDLYLVEVFQAITVDSAHFIRDKIDYDLDYINKVYLDASEVDGVKYQFHNCHFKNIGRDMTDCGRSGFEDNSGMGGGLTVKMNNITRNMQLQVTWCYFEYNCAESGGGLHLTLMDSIQNSSVTVKNSMFYGNNARHNGGGVSIEYIQYSEKMIENAIQFINCDFTNNKAMHGGAAFLSSSLDYSSCEPQDSIEFEECTWTNNIGTLGSAVYMAPYSSSYVFLVGGSFLEPVFSNCYFENNTVYSQLKVQNTANNISIFGKGTIYSNELNIKFKGNMTFSRNTGSALFLVSSIVTFTQCNATFANNEGYQGGSMSMLRNSAIHINDHSYLLFDSNIAKLYGGAIYHETYNDPFETGIYRCFIRYIGENAAEKLCKVEFKNNSIRNEARNDSSVFRGLSIFLYSLSPCRLSNHHESVEDTLKSIANIIFLDYKEESEVSTLASKYTNVSTLPAKFIPGKETNLNIEVEDDTNTTVTQVTYHASLSDKSSDINLDPAYEFVSNNIIKFIGSPGSSAVLSILINYRPDYQLSVFIELEDCPPGYVLVSGRCECSANTDDSFYQGIKKCNLSTFQAIIIQGYWAGYINTSSDSFRTSNCPFSFCNVSEKSEFHLPLKKSQLDLCSNGRHGRVCSLCSDTNTLFYHTQGNAHCGNADSCNIGALYYLLLEIIPVTVFFVIIILFDVKLTSGNLCGFLLYAQIFSTLEVTAGNFITFPRFAKYLLISLKCLVGIFSLDFFLLPRLSFCIFRNANYMHLLLFSYLTIFYAFILIILTILAINYRFKYFCMKKIGSKYFRNTSIIHGLSSFLVICFARVTKASLQILNPVTLFGKAGEPMEMVVYYHGEYDYFGKEHLPFAILAIIALLLACLPVLLLLMYPTCCQILAIIKPEESAINTKICNLFPLEILRPFFDSFQSTFKDNHRYFAGFFFLYRFAALAINNASNTNTKFFFSLEIFLVLAVTLHGVIQPHKNHRHNQVDISILALLAVLNGITSFNYHLSLAEVNNNRTIEILATLQILLAYLPIVYMIILLSLKAKERLHEWCSKKCDRKEDCMSEEITENEILELLDQHSVDTNFSSSYNEV